ncbi:MAG: allose kinase [Spirochaetaceae bacterium]|jgi:allose kinase|nr:allose kinase [Spirochaetaceae bacterium]
MLTLGLDIGGTNIRSGFVDGNLRLTDFLITKTEDVFAAAAGGNGKKLTAYIAELAAKHSAKPDCVSLGVPSTVDKTNRRICSTPNIPGLNDIPIAGMVEEALNLPCYVQRDVCFLLLHDIYEHKLSGAEDFIAGFYAGTGLGNAIAYQGKLVTGKNGAAAELGHIPVLGRTGICGCGNSGCIELYASGKHLAEIRDRHYPALTIDEALRRHSQEKPIVDFLDALGAAIATEINILDPGHVILGGGVILQDGFPRAALEERILAHTRRPYPANGLEFIYSRESQENGVIGAALFAQSKM